MSPEKPTAVLDSQLREACATLNRRLRAGESVRTEELLSEFPELAAHGDCLLELAYTEFVARDAQGETCDVEEWYARFPQWANDLRELFDVHRFVESAAEETALPADDTNGDDDSYVPGQLLFHENVDTERRLGNYELIEEIGRGGMGVVYKARQFGVRRVVALKLILAGEHAGRERHERFQAEAETVGRLAHPNIVQIYEVGNEQGRPYLCLEYLDGGSLDRKLNGVPMPAREAASLLVILANAVRHAHERGVIHRDLKPANILLTLEGAPKITDFGLAKRIFEEHSGQTASGAMLGTPSYMAPEQALGNSRDSGVAADVYALGAILYEVLTGRPPFRGATLLDTLEQVRSQEPAPPRQLIGNLPRDLETICLKCLQKAPAQRYASAADLADDFDRFLNRMPIRARPVGFVGRLTRWTVRNPVLAPLSAALAVVLTVVVIAAPIVAVTQMRLRQEVQDQLNETVREGRARSASLLATRARLAMDDAPQRGALLAIEAMETHLAADERPPAAIEQTLRDALAVTSGRGLAGHLAPLTSTAFTADGKWLVTGSADGTARLWPMDAADPVAGYVTLTGHRGPIRGLTLSNDSRWLATAADDHTVRLWDLQSASPPKHAAHVLEHAGPLTAVTFSPNGHWLFTADKAGVGKLHRMSLTDPPALVKERKLDVSIIDGHFSPDGAWLAIGSVDKQARVWQVSDAGLGNELVLKGHTGAVVAVAFDPRGPRLATASVDRTVRLWDLSSADTVQSSKVLDGHENYVTDVAFSPNGRWLVSSSYDNTARRWDLDAVDPAAASTVLNGHTERVYSVAVSSDSRWLATCSRDRTVRVWDLTRDDADATAKVLHGHDDGVQATAFSADGHWLASAGADGTARIWDLSAGFPTASAAQCYAGNEQKIQQIGISRSGRLLAICAAEGPVHVWDRETRRELASLPQNAFVQFVAFSPDERWLVTSAMDKSPVPPQLWDLRANDPAAAPTALNGHTQSIESLVVDPKGAWIATGSRFDDGEHETDGTVRIWALETGTAPTGIIVARHQADVTILVALPGQNLLASASMDGDVRLTNVEKPWNATDEKSESLASADLTGLVAVAKGRGLASVDRAGNVNIIDPAAPTSRPITLYAGKSSLRALTASAEGRWLAAIDALDQVLLWDMQAFQQQTPRPLAPIVLSGDEKEGRTVVGCTFSPTGRRLTVYATDGGIRVWELDEQGPAASPIVLRGHTQQVQSAAFTPDGRTLISGSYDGTVREWPLEQDDLLEHARNVVGRELTMEERRQFVEQ